MMATVVSQFNVSESAVKEVSPSPDLDRKVTSKNSPSSDGLPEAAVTQERDSSTKQKQRKGVFRSRPTRPNRSDHRGQKANLQPTEENRLDDSERIPLRRRRISDEEEKDEVDSSSSKSEDTDQEVQENEQEEESLEDTGKLNGNASDLSSDQAEELAGSKVEEWERKRNEAKKERYRQIEEYKKKLEDPTYVPHIGAFFLHDDRFQSMRRGRGRGRGRPVWESTRGKESSWAHDKFEELEDGFESHSKVVDPKQSSQPTQRGHRRGSHRQRGGHRPTASNVNGSAVRKSSIDLSSNPTDLLSQIADDTGLSTLQSSKPADETKTSSEGHSTKGAKGRGYLLPSKTAAEVEVEASVKQSSSSKKPVAVVKQEGRYSEQSNSAITRNRNEIGPSREPYKPSKFPGMNSTRSIDTGTGNGLVASAAEASSLSSSTSSSLPVDPLDAHLQMTDHATHASPKAESIEPSKSLSQDSNGHARIDPSTAAAKSDFVTGKNELKRHSNNTSSQKLSIEAAPFHFSGSSSSQNLDSTYMTAGPAYRGRRGKGNGYTGRRGKNLTPESSYIDFDSTIPSDLIASGVYIPQNGGFVPSYSPYQAVPATYAPVQVDPSIPVMMVANPQNTYNAAFMVPDMSSYAAYGMAAQSSMGMAPSGLVTITQGGNGMTYYDQAPQGTTFFYQGNGFSEAPSVEAFEPPKPSLTHISKAVPIVAPSQTD